MRLIDADALEEYIESDKSGLLSAREFQRDYIECIYETPTAFDLEKVVEQLEEYIKESSNVDYNRAMIEAIKIVKAGGID